MFYLKWLTSSSVAGVQSFLFFIIFFGLFKNPVTEAGVLCNHLASISHEVINKYYSISWKLMAFVEKMTAKPPVIQAYRLVSDTLASTCRYGKNVYSFN